MTKKKVYDKQFKMDAVNFGRTHPQMLHVEVAKHLDIPLVIIIVGAKNLKKLRLLVMYIEKGLKITIMPINWYLSTLKHFTTV